MPTIVTSAAVPIGTNVALAAYETKYNSQRHIIITGSDYRVYELVNDNNAPTWTTNVISALATGPLAAPQSFLTGYVTAVGGQEQQHVNYVDAEGDVHELYYDTEWRHNDLFAAAGVNANLATGANPLAANPWSLVAYPTAYDGNQHVVFVSSAGALDELLYPRQVPPFPIPI